MTWRRPTARRQPRPPRLRLHETAINARETAHAGATATRIRPVRRTPLSQTAAQLAIHGCSATVDGDCEEGARPLLHTIATYTAPTLDAPNVGACVAHRSVPCGRRVATILYAPL
jgi:hypothetical protein